VVVTFCGHGADGWLPSVGDVPTLLLVALEPGAPVREVSAVAKARRLCWIGWNVADNSNDAIAAYQAGARLVLPATIDAQVLLQAAELALPLAPQSSPVTGSERHYRRGQIILFDDDVLLEVKRGVIRLTVVHEDGAEVLLGIHGPGEVCVAHANDGCNVQLIAHTAATVVVRRWDAPAAANPLAERLRERVLQLEAWAAMQARPYLDQKLVGILSLLAGQFGRPHPLGTIIDLRITHAELASAVGASRPTVTRLLGELRGRGLLTWLGKGAGERICLLAPAMASPAHARSPRSGRLQAVEGESGGQMGVVAPEEIVLARGVEEARDHVPVCR